MCAKYFYIGIAICMSRFVCIHAKVDFIIDMCRCKQLHLSAVQDEWNRLMTACNDDPYICQ